MDQPIYLSAELTLAPSPKNQDQDNGDKAISGVAYSGDPVFKWGEQFVIDVSSLTAETPIAILHQHRHSEPVGVIDSIGNDGNSVAIESGRVFSGMESDPLPKRIAEKASRGFPYELSVGIYDGSTEIIEPGDSQVVNGRTIHGPARIIRNAVLREVSIVALGADPNTQADIAAEQPNHEDQVMPKKGETDAGDSGNIAELTARVAELKQQVETEKKRADDAEAALLKLQKDIRLEAVKQLLDDIDIEFSDEAAKPYLEMSDEAFSALADQVRSKLRAGTAGATALFGDVPNDGGDAGQSHGATANLSINDIYAKRRTA